MFFCFMFLFQFLLCVQGEVWTHYTFPANIDKTLKPHLAICARKADDMEHCAARIHRLYLHCDSLSVDWCETRMKLPEYAYIEKTVVKITSGLLNNTDNTFRHISTNMPVLMEPGVEITIAFTPQPVWPHLVVGLVTGRFGGYAMKLSIRQNSAEILHEIRLNGTGTTVPTLVTYPHTLHKMSVLTIRCTASGLETIVDGGFLFMFNHTLVPQKIRRLKFALHDFTTKFHFVRFIAAVDP